MIRHSVNITKVRNQYNCHSAKVAYNMKICLNTKCLMYVVLLLHIKRNSRNIMLKKELNKTFAQYVVSKSYRNNSALTDVRTFSTNHSCFKIKQFILTLIIYWIKQLVSSTFENMISKQTSKDYTLKNKLFFTSIS